MYTVHVFLYTCIQGNQGYVYIQNNQGYGQISTNIPANFVETFDYFGFVFFPQISKKNSRNLALPQLNLNLLKVVGWGYLVTMYN